MPDMPPTVAWLKLKVHSLECVAYTKLRVLGDGLWDQAGVRRKKGSFGTVGGD